MANARKPALDMGALQSNLEAAAKNHKAAILAAEKANKAADKAEADYQVAQKSLAAGMAQLLASTKVV